MLQPKIRFVRPVVLPSTLIIMVFYTTVYAAKLELRWPINYPLELYGEPCVNDLTVSSITYKLEVDPIAQVCRWSVAVAVGHGPRCTIIFL